MKAPDYINAIIDKIESTYDIINNKYYGAYIVGGACRDYLFGKEPKDYDITTDCEPRELLNIFPGAKRVSESFPVVVVPCNDGKFVEVATYRIDKGDHAEITKSLEEDVLRRDFTINAICYKYIPNYHNRRNNNGFIDYVGGIQDINDRILKFIGEPEKRILDDPVRILRGIRFASQYNLTIEKETYFEMFRMRGLIKSVPRERLQLEVIKAFKSNNTHRFLTMLNEMEMLEFVFPKISMLRCRDGGHYHHECLLSHVFNSVKAIEEKDWRLKIAALYHDCGKYFYKFNENNQVIFPNHDIKGLDLIEYDLKDYLKFSNEVVDYVKNLTSVHMHHVTYESEKNIKKTYTKFVEKGINLKDFVYLRYADSKANALSDYRKTFQPARYMYKQFLKVIRKKVPFSIKDLNINGNEIMEILNIKPGRRVGEILQDIFDKVQEDLLKK